MKMPYGETGLFYQPQGDVESRRKMLESFGYDKSLYPYERGEWYQPIEKIRCQRCLKVVTGWSLASHRRTKACRGNIYQSALAVIRSLLLRGVKSRESILLVL